MRHGIVNYCSFAAAIALAMAPAWGQPPGRPAQSRGGFQVPAAGEMLPEVKLLDDQGREFSTSVLKEHYTVLVFGCLT